MIPIIRWELARRRNYILWWCFGIAAMVVILMIIYPSIHQQAAQLDQIMQQLPESIRALRGGDTDLTSPVGYLNAEVFYITLPLLMIIMTVGLGSGLLAKDEQDRTLELLLARPVSRGSILLGKALSGLIITAATGATAAIVAIIFAKLVHMDIAALYVLLATAGATVFAASFGAIAFSLSAASILSRKLGITIAVVASFGGYILESLSSVSDYIKTPATFLPYHYYLPKDMLAGHFSRGFVIYMASICIASIIISYAGFRRRDIG